MTELELDEKALAKAAQAVGVDMWRVPANPATIARAAVTAYLAAARPTPDAEELARSLVPPGYHVIADDDLRRLYGLGIAFKGLLNTLGEEDGEHYPLNDEDLALLDRLRALIGDE